MQKSLAGEQESNKQSNYLTSCHFNFGEFSRYPQKYPQNQKSPPFFGAQVTITPNKMQAYI
jgi:hypothetical protein